MRIGNSFLGDHKRRGRSKIECPECRVFRKNETNEHFFLECPKYTKNRVKLMKEIREVQKKTGSNEVMKCILGFYPNIYKSKIKMKKFRDIILKGLRSSIQYIKDTRRFIHT